MKPGSAIARVVMMGASASLLGACSVASGGDAGPTPVPLETPTSTPTSSASTAPDLDRFYDQRLSWSPCGKGNRCADLEVPLDYQDPSSSTIEISLLKVPAQGKALGSLVVNPGGPGGSGVDYATNADSYFGEALQQNFDIVGFDPRGVGRSEPIDCVTDARLDEFVASDPDPETPDEVEEGRAILEEFADGCMELTSDISSHASTVEVARDIDVLRSALGDEQLTWFGASYGTLLGATYAELFPERVGRMVLDGALDPALDQVEVSLTQARGFERALTAYLQHCVGTDACALGSDVASARRGLTRLFDSIDAEPLPASDGRQLEIGNAVLGVWLPLYSEANWNYLDAALAAAQQGDGTILLQLSDIYVAREADGTYSDNSTEALLVVNCLDSPESVPLEDVGDYEARFAKASPTFGRIFAFGLSSCSEWPVEDAPRLDSITAEGAAPILVVGTTRDPATPLEWAENLAEQLESGVLMVRDGDGHTGYRAGNECIDEAVESYLVSGKVPEDGTRC